MRTFLKFTAVLFLFCVSLHAQWVNQPTPTGFNILSCSFPSVTTGFAVGYGNLILKTTNSGQNWQNISFPGTAQNNNSVWFLNNNTGFLASTDHTLYKTTNNGVNWTAAFDLQNQGYRIYFINSTTGWVLGAPKLYKTTNAGINWSLVNSNVGYDYTFVNENTGWMSIYSNGSSTINKSTDGGISWSPQYSTSNFRVIYSMNFVDINTGWATGYREVILKTTDGGVNWVQQRDANNSVGLYSVSFVNASTGWTVGDNGKALGTTDGGANWSLVQLSGSRMEEVEFVNQTTGWIVGASGKIYNTSNLGGLTGVTPISETASEFSLAQNYPNPFNPETRINFSLPNPSEGGAINTKMILYDITGREVAVLLNESLSPGSYEVIFDASGYSSGMYFYKLTAGSFSETKKMLMVK
jgi:photosystem II stability/assembly factor-like uncharacterized protein